MTGVVAQLGERVVRNDEVRGSIPLDSTTHPPVRGGLFLCLVLRATSATQEGEGALLFSPVQGGKKPRCPAALRCAELYGFRFIPAQSGKRRLCIHIAESVFFPTRIRSAAQLCKSD